MTVATILKDKGANIISASPNDTLSNICAILGERRIGAVMVLNTDESIAGIVSERDIVGAISREGAAVLERSVADFMTRNVVTCKSEDSINDVMSKMTTGRFRHVPVLDEGKLIGLISIGDVIKERIVQAERDAEEMRSYISMA